MGRLNTLIKSNASLEEIMRWFCQGGDLAVVAAKEAVNILGVQGAVAALQRSHGSGPEIVWAAWGAVNAGQGITHSQSHVKHLLQLALQRLTPLSKECTVLGRFTIMEV